MKKVINLLLLIIHLFLQAQKKQLQLPNKKQSDHKTAAAKSANKTAANKTAANTAAAAATGGAKPTAAAVGDGTAAATSEDKIAALLQSGKHHFH